MILKGEILLIRETTSMKGTQSTAISWMYDFGLGKSFRVRSESIRCYEIGLR